MPGDTVLDAFETAHWTKQEKRKRQTTPNLKKLHPSEGIQAVNIVFLKTLNEYNMDINVGVDTFCEKIRAK